MADYVIETVVDAPVEETIGRVREALAGEGMGVLSEIRVHEKLREKLDVDIPPYIILGACHPPSAHQAITAEPAIGVLMPCNVVVQQIEAGTAVRAVRPSVSLGVTGRADLAHLADEVEARLQRTVQSLGCGAC
jgi:uncharacterized protein (DUF302 family)